MGAEERAANGKAPRESSHGRSRGRWGWAAAGLGLAVVVGVYLVICIGDPIVRFWIGTEDRVVRVCDYAVFRREGRELLVGIEALDRFEFLRESFPVRLTRIDGRSGDVLGRSDVGEGHWELLGYGQRVLWLVEGETCLVQARDPWTGRLLADTAEIVRGNPQLGGRMVVGSEAHARGCGNVAFPAENGDDLLVTLRDGGVQRIAAGTWRAAEEGGAPRRLDPSRVGAKAMPATSRAVRLGNETWELSGDEPKWLHYENTTMCGTLDPMPGSGRFLGGVFACWAVSCTPPVRLANPDGFLVLHRSAEELRYPDMLTRIARDGETVWTFAMRSAVRGLDGYVGLFALSERLVLEVEARTADGEGNGARSSPLIALDSRTGRVAWSYGP